MGSKGAGKGKPQRSYGEKVHAQEVNATRKAQGKTQKSVASVSRSKARAQAHRARISQPVPDERIAATVQDLPEPPAAPTWHLASTSSKEGEVLPSEQPEETDAPSAEVREPPSQMEVDHSPVTLSGELLTTKDTPVVKPRPPPRSMGASGLPEVPFPDFKDARSFQGRKLSKPVFLASIRLIRGLCCYGCNVSFGIGQLSSHVFSARHQQMCLDLAR